MSLLTEHLLKQEKQTQSILRKYSDKQSKRMLQLRSSGVYFQKRKTIKRTDKESPEKIIYTSIIDQNFYNLDYQSHQNFNAQQVKQPKLNLYFQEQPNIVKSQISFYTCQQGNENFQYEDLNISSKLQLAQQKQQLNNKPIKLQSLITSTTQSLPNKLLIKKEKSKSIHKKNLLDRSQRRRYKFQQTSFKQKVYKFFGQGINSLVLHLGSKVINVLIYNVLLDVIFRLALIFICFEAFFVSHGKHIFLFPLYVQIICRFLMFLTLVKMCFDQKCQVSRCFQKAINTKSYVDLQTDRLFMRQYDYKNIISIVLKCMIPPQIIIIAIEQNERSWKKIFFLVNLIFKSIENIFVFSMFASVLFRQSYPKQLLIPTVSIILEEIVRYIVNYLVVNTLSLSK